MAEEEDVELKTVINQLLVQQIIALLVEVVVVAANLVATNQQSDLLRYAKGMGEEDDVHILMVATNQPKEPRFSVFFMEVGNDVGLMVVQDLFKGQMQYFVKNTILKHFNVTYSYCSIDVSSISPHISNAYHRMPFYDQYVYLWENILLAITIAHLLFSLLIILLRTV